MDTKKRISLALMGLSMSALSACSVSENAVAPPPVARQSAPAREYRIGPDDELHISVWKNEALSRTVPVRPDGKISMPLVNDVQAAGLTPMQLREVLRKSLAKYVNNPEVSVIVQAVKSFKISVIGEVWKPGTYEMAPQSTVLDALARAEGVTEFASRGRIVILRHQNGTTERVPFNYKKAIVAGGEQENFYLRPGDIVVVP